MFKLVALLAIVAVAVASPAPGLLAPAVAPVAYASPLAYSAAYPSVVRAAPLAYAAPAAYAPAAYAAPAYSPYAYGAPAVVKTAYLG